MGDTWKRVYSNEDTRSKALPWFYENFDKDGFSIWRFDFKYNDELSQIFMSCNQIGGFFNRLEGSRKYLMGTGGVLVRTTTARSLVSLSSAARTTSRSSASRRILKATRLLRLTSRSQRTRSSLRTCLPGRSRSTASRGLTARCSSNFLGS